MHVWGHVVWVCENVCVGRVRMSVCLCGVCGCVRMSMYMCGVTVCGYVRMSVWSVGVWEERQLKGLFNQQLFCQTSSYYAYYIHTSIKNKCCLLSLT